METCMTFGKDIIATSFRKVFIKNIKECFILEEIPNFAYLMYYMDRPILKVEIVGILREIRRKENKVTVVCDDGTGVIECIKFIDIDEKTQVDSICIGDLISIKGCVYKASLNFNEYQYILKINFLDVVTDPNYELLHWV